MRHKMAPAVLNIQPVSKDCKVKKGKQAQVDYFLLLMSHSLSHVPRSVGTQLEPLGA